MQRYILMFLSLSGRFYRNLYQQFNVKSEEPRNFLTIKHGQTKALWIPEWNRFHRIVYSQFGEKL